MLDNVHSVLSVTFSSLVRSREGLGMNVEEAGEHN